jgi:hypothetical protein
MPSAKRPVLDGAMLRHRLAALRRRLRLVAACRGTGFLLTILLATTLLTGALDWRYHLPALVRAVILVGMLVGAVGVAFRYLFRPLTARADDLTLALRVEQEYPQLNDALASTVQFLERASSETESSSALEREAVRRALAKASGCDFRRVVSSRGLRWAVLGGGLATAAAAGLFLLWPTMALTAVVRLANPFGDHDWPKRTQLEIESPRLRIGRNEAFDVRGLVRGVIPAQATVVFRFEGAPSIEHHCDIKTAPGEDGETSPVGRLVTHLEAGRVQRNFRFQVRANDAVSPEYRVEVLPPPSLVALDSKPSPQLRLFYPAYTDLPSPEDLSPGTGNIEAVYGTAARLRARTDRPLKQAWIEYQPEQPTALLSAFLAPLGAADVSGTLSLLAGGQSLGTHVPAVLDDDKCTFTIDFTPGVNGMYVLHFEDESGLRNHRLFELRLHADPAPTVHLERPSASRDMLSVLPTAELTLEVLADDQQYALRSVFLEYRTQREQPAQRLFLYEPDSGLGPMLSLWTGAGVLAAPPQPLRPRRLEFRQKLPLQTIRHPDGASLKEGDVVLLQACADDFDNVTLNKQPGRSHEVEIRIVGRNAFDLAVNQEQANVQQELLRLREKEREAMQKVTEVENRLKKGDKVTPEDQEKLLQAEQLQQQIRERIGTEKEGLRAELTRILETLKQNGMEKTAAQERMNDVGRELERLAENELEQIEPRLTNARQLAELLDEKVREERKAQLDIRARAAEQESRAAQEAAEKKTQEAARAEQQAEQSASAADKTRLNQDAKWQRERAEELRQKAQELKQQAERDRRDAAQAPDPVQPRQVLAEARKGQEEVEKTLNDLLTRMEPWSNAHEIKGEANRLLEEQKQLQAAVEKLMEQEKGFLGKKPEELDRRQRAELEDLTEAQKRLEERTQQLLGKMERVAEQRAGKDPDLAQELRQASEQAKKSNIGEQMKSAREQIEQNELIQARTNQKNSVAELEKLVKNLEDRREAELDRLIKKRKQAEKELAELIQEQDELRKKVKEADKIADPAQREEELKKLARRQKELQQKTNEMVEKLSRLRAGRASQALSRAGGQMEEAGKQMEGGQGDEQDQQEVLDRLNEARAELERARKEAEEELGREQMARLADTIKRLKERQEAFNAESARIQQEVLRRKEWARSLSLSLLRQRDAQRGLGAETEEIASKQLTGAPVFARLTKRAAGAMEDAAGRMEAIVQESRRVGGGVDPARVPDAELARLQQLALRRLSQVADTLKEAAEKPRQQARGGGGGGGGGSARPNDSVPPAAQIKLLRDLQKDINQRTDAFRKEHPDVKNLDRHASNELQTIRKDQQDVAELIDELNRPAGEPGAVEGEKK